MTINLVETIVLKGNDIIQKTPERRKMTDNLLTLNVKLSGVKLLVRANSLKCTNDTSRKAHDNLNMRIESIITLTRQGINAHRKLANASSESERMELGEILWNVQEEIEAMQSGPEGLDLLDNNIGIDHATEEWYDPRTQSWVSFYESPPPVANVDPSYLDGLSDIIKMIKCETGIRFNTEISLLLHPTDILPLEPQNIEYHIFADIDPERYERDCTLSRGI